PDRGVSQRGADLGAERPLPYVFSRSGGAGRPKDLHDGRVWARRIPGAYAKLRVGSFLEPNSRLGRVAKNEDWSCSRHAGQVKAPPEEGVRRALQTELQ